MHEMVKNQGDGGLAAAGTGLVMGMAAAGMFHNLANQMFEPMQEVSGLGQKGQNGKICPECGMNNGQGARFCSSCGRPLGQKEQPRKMFCSNCGKELEPEMRFCSNCGAQVRQ